MIVFNDDTLLLACKDIKKAVIPPYIKNISPFSFCHCNQLESIEISEDLELETIGYSAFNSASLIEKIFIPKRVKIIENDVFNNCNNLKTVEFATDSNLCMTKKGVFDFTSIERISFPSGIQILEDGLCKKSSKIKHIQIPENNSYFSCLNIKGHEVIVGKSDINSNIFDVIVFVSPTGRNPFIPSFVKCIHGGAFYNSQSIDTVEFSSDSQLVSFVDYGFDKSSIKFISIPPLVEKLIVCLFNKCIFLKNIEFLGDNICNKECFVFKNCCNLFLISFPNAQIVVFSCLSSIMYLNDLSFFIKEKTEIKVETYKSFGYTNKNE